MTEQYDDAKARAKFLGAFEDVNEPDYIERVANVVSWAIIIAAVALVAFLLGGEARP